MDQVNVGSNPTPYPLFDFSHIIFVMVMIERRYQYRGKDGVQWTSWFVVDHCDTLEEAKDKLKLRKKQKEPDKNLLGEYRIAE